MGRTTVSKNECCICRQMILGEMYVLEKVKVDSKFLMGSLPAEWQHVFHPECFCQHVKKRLTKAMILERICE